MKENSAKHTSIYNSIQQQIEENHHTAVSKTFEQKKNYLLCKLHMMNIFYIISIDTD